VRVSHGVAQADLGVEIAPLGVQYVDIVDTAGTVLQVGQPNILAGEEAADIHELHSLITAHLRHTGSPLAQRILDNWSIYADQFIKVMPIEYKKVLHDERIEQLNSKIARVERDY